MERVDGTQARLKREEFIDEDTVLTQGGKGGWDSGEIETVFIAAIAPSFACGKGGWDSGEIETSSRAEDWT